MAASGASKVGQDSTNKLPGHIAASVATSHVPLRPSNVGGSNKSGCVCCCALARSCISLKKRRFVQDGYDLDLSYITDRIIAMGFPSHGVEACYRNPYEDERRFLDERHDGKYKVFNLCGEVERQYDPSLFYGRASSYGWLDHEACPFDMMFEACGDAAAFLAQDPGHVVALHCKAGKGRTGLMACCLLLHMGVCASPQDAMQLYATRRTFNGKGLTIPSQKRYVCCYALQLAAIRRQFAAQGDDCAVADAEAVASEQTEQSSEHTETPTSPMGQDGESHPEAGAASPGAAVESPAVLPAAAASAAAQGEEKDEDGVTTMPAGHTEADGVESAPTSTADEAQPAAAAIGPWLPGANATCVPHDTTAQLLSICIRGRAIGYSHLGVSVFRRVPGSLQRELVLRCPPLPHGGCSDTGTQALPSASMPPALFQGMDVPLLGSLAPAHAAADSTSLAIRDVQVPVAGVLAEGDLTVWQGADVLGDGGMQMAATDYFVVVTGHSSQHGAGKKVAAAWVHTAFLPRCSAAPGTPAAGMLSLPKGALDKVFKDKEHKKVSSHFQLHLLYTAASGAA